MNQVKTLFPEAKNIQLVSDVSDDLFVAANFPAVQRAYRVDGTLSAYVVSSVGYNGPIDMLVAIEAGRLKDLMILSHTETEEYAKYIAEDWFLSRFRDKSADHYLNLVVLDAENPEDIVQVTGATVSSQAVLNGVNAALGAYQYLENDIQMEKVSDVVPQEMWQKDENSFSVNWEDGSIRVDSEELKTYEQTEMDVVLINTTGTETKMHVKGPTLETVLAAEGIDLNTYAGIGVTGRDGYYTLIDKDKLSNNPVILGWEFDNAPILEEEKPIRVVLPNEMGPYWVKMVTSIDLYKDISPKAIQSVYLFNPLTEDIAPYYYEYYGSKDKAIEIGKILNKFDSVDLKGFFTMASNDGMVKNETISLVRQRYYIKIEGDNAPMNIAPNFKLGMNVRDMCYFSTTTDAVIFPETMATIVRTLEIDGYEGLLLEDVLLQAGMTWSEGDTFTAVNSEGEQIPLSIEALSDCYILDQGENASLVTPDSTLLTDLLRIDKDEK
jgi:uncharacterized protein with FMN-binding domain/DMSO/TMAO reductase YedYZ molybdopterin-dependent catalytic subunit